MSLIRRAIAVQGIGYGRLQVAYQGFYKLRVALRDGVFQAVFRRRNRRM